ncbi:SURF1 family cytochrome oxidase biogenesis protein [Frigoribacterium sp. CG_9.8]|uniref:SURF1 family cytochrome oxidase biogenesis protein n=1 Tax=Frigoribacterium sp. CG_9.8 TaxID=2787733 RepID=UPI0018CA521E|nr:SURF1 family cytochrome oxidase biogenesis protein [Frigoribacterium sp. CG_9.8]MBG6108531.1 cytochrome oxidase assembly protein ShyY1 [Frigoribacterium sp. CG_9.8]
MTEAETVWTVARRPRWIAALVLALLVAAGFAGLSQWQLARAIATGTVIERDTETVLPLQDVAKPQSPVTDRATAQLVTVTGRWNAVDYSIVSDRLNAGTAGYWVVGHFSAELGSGTANPGETAGLAVAVGWSADRAGAASALTALTTLGAEASGSAVPITGRYIPAEGPQDSDFERGKLSTMTPGAFLNTWKIPDAAGIYGGYLTSAVAAQGLTRIDSPKPSSAVELNLLNIFYAVEWVVFAGFAIFLWYRLVRDTWEREREEAEEAHAAASTAAEAKPAQVN